MSGGTCPTLLSHRFNPVPLLLGCVLLWLPSESRSQDQGVAWDARRVLEQKQFVSPPDAISQAVLAPRYLNVTLSEVSADKQWFLQEVSDGPVTMDVFSKPFDELGGQFIDFTANRSRRLTTRSNAGIVATSATDGTRVEIDVSEGARVSNASWSPRGSQLALLRSLQRRHAHLRGRPGHGPVGAGNPSTRTGHAGDVVRVDGGRRQDRHGADSGRPPTEAYRARRTDGPAGQDDRRG